MALPVVSRRQVIKALTRAGFEVADLGREYRALESDSGAPRFSVLALYAIVS